MSWTLITGTPEPDPSQAGMWPAIMGTIWVCAFCALITLPLGIGTAVFIEEFKPRSKVGLWIYGLIQLNISNLAGVPSVVYGILGLTAFATMYGIFGSDKDPDFRFGADYYYQYLSETMNPMKTTTILKCLRWIARPCVMP